jgi:hypothetical protein
MLHRFLVFRNQVDKTFWLTTFELLNNWLVKIGLPYEPRTQTLIFQSKGVKTTIIISSIFERFLGQLGTFGYIWIHFRTQPANTINPKPKTNLKQPVQKMQKGVVVLIDKKSIRPRLFYVLYHWNPNLHNSDINSKNQAKTNCFKNNRKTEQVNIHRHKTRPVIDL